MASNLLAMASNLYNSNDLQPTSDGLHGLQPNSGLQPTITIYVPLVLTN